MTTIERYGYIAARIFISLIFINSLIGKFNGFSTTQQFMASYGFFVPFLFLLLAIILETAGTISLITGYRIRQGALLLLIFVCMTTFIFHTKLIDSNQFAMFFKNIAIIGGLGILAIQGPWRSAGNGMSRFEQQAYTASRICIGVLFVVSAIAKMAQYDATKEIMIEMGLSSIDMMLTLAIIIELMGGILIFTGIQIQYTALGLIVFLIPVTLLFHMELGDIVQRIMFFKNMAIIGSLGLLALFGPRPWRSANKT